MKLFQTYDSPFPTRVRLLLMAKGLSAEIIQPPGFHYDGLTKEEYLKINPIGRVPALVLDDGRALPESEVICEYLEDAYPEPSLRPADAFERARMRLLSRICDFYLVMAMVPLFDYSARPRKTWDQQGIEKAFAKISDALAYLEQFIGEDGYAVGKAVSQADGALAPQLILTTEWAPPTFNMDDPLLRYPKLLAYWTAIQKDPLVSRLITETRDAIVESKERARAYVKSRSESQTPS